MKKCRLRIEAGTGNRRCLSWLAVAMMGTAAAFAPADNADAQGSVVTATATPYVPDAAVQAAALTLARQAAAAVAPPGARIVATAGAIDRRLRLAPCARVEPHLVAGLPTWGTTRVGLRCTAGSVAWRAYLPVQVQVWAPAWTSRAALPAGAVVLADQWEVAEADWAAAPAPPLGPAEMIAGRTLARPVSAGQALRDADLQARRWFTNGQAVRIVATGPGYSIHAEGHALGHGIEGHPVRVRTEAGRILVGQPVGEALVEVRP